MGAVAEPDRTEKALSFVQIHDLLRDARNNAGIIRTNEELRSLIKLAINAGKLVRSGKGTRVNYRLAPPEVVAIEPAKSTDEVTAASEPVPSIESRSVLESEPTVKWSLSQLRSRLSSSRQNLPRQFCGRRSRCS